MSPKSHAVTEYCRGVREVIIIALFYGSGGAQRLCANGTGCLELATRMTARTRCNSSLGVTARPPCNITLSTSQRTATSLAERAKATHTARTAPSSRRASALSKSLRFVFCWKSIGSFCRGSIWYVGCPFTFGVGRCEGCPIDYHRITCGGPRLPTELEYDPEVIETYAAMIKITLNATELGLEGKCVPCAQCQPG